RPECRTRFTDVGRSPTCAILRSSDSLAQSLRPPSPRTDLTAYSGLLRVLVCDRSRDMLAPVSGTEAFLVHPGGAPSTPVVGLGDRRGGRRQARSEPTVKERAGSR